MGCGASTAVQATPLPNSPARAPPPGKPLEEWDQEEVEHWFSRIPRVYQYRPCLLPDEGCVVAKWTEQYLVRRGVPEDDAFRIIAYRDRVLRSGPRVGPATAGAAEPSQVVATVEVVGVPVSTAAVVPAAAAGPVVANAKPVATTAASPSSFSQQSSAAVTTTSSISGAAASSDGAAAGSATQDGPGGKEEDAAAGQRSKRESIVALARKGLSFARLALEKLGPSLPFPGEQAANLLLQVLVAVDAAMNTCENVLALRDRAAAVMDILDAYREQLKGLQRYKEVVGRYMDLLQGIQSFAQAYASRNWIMRLVTGDSDAGHYEALKSEMAATGEMLMALVAVDSNARIQGVEAVVSESCTLLKEMAQYRDPLADARALVEKFGGIEAVLADSGKLGEVMQKLDISARVTVQAVTSVLQSHLDKGPQRHIKQPELRLLWAKHYGGEAEVPWFAFWEVFPELMRDVPADAALIETLCRLFSDASAKTAFQRAVGRANKDTVSVWELRVCFNGDDSLLRQVQRLIGGCLQVQALTAVAAGTAVPSSIGADVPAAEAAAGSLSAVAAATAPDDKRLAEAAREPHSHQLPPLPQNYLGREEDTTAVLGHLRSSGSLVLLAPGGMGKSCLAADVGWRLLREGGGVDVGGVLWVDLREALSTADMEARFCATLGLEADKTDNTSRIVAALKLIGRNSSSSAPAGHLPAVLVIVDNVEDAVLQPDSANALQRLVGKVLAEVPSARLLITSRTSLGSYGISLPERHVGKIGHDAAVQLVLGSAADLTPTQAAEVAQACCYVPLLLCLVAEALAMGRLAMQDVSKLLAKGGDANTSQAMVHVVLASLRRPQQLAGAKLAVFPTAFQVDTAAETLEISEPEARALCAVLCQYSVLQRAGPQCYVMHMLVRQTAAELGAQLDAGLQRRAEQCYVRVFLRLLHEWGVMYRTGKEWQLALAAAREHTADITHTCDLLPAVGDDLALDLHFTNEVLRLLYAAGLLGCFQAPCSSLLAKKESANSAAREDQLVVAILQWMLSYLYSSAGQYTLAATLAQKCVEIHKTVLGAEHPVTLTSLNHLATCMRACGHYSEAEPMYREVLQASRRVLGVVHMETMGSLNNLANCISSCGRHTEAEPMYREVLEVRRQMLGADHPDTLGSLNNLANCISNDGRYSEAEVIYREVLEARRRVLGPEHSATLASLNNLAICIKASDRFGEAEPMYREVLEARRRVLGVEHPDTLGSLNNLAKCISDDGRNAEAEVIYREALEARRRVLGAEHPETLRSLSNLAGCISCSRYEEAEPMYREVLEVRRRILGADHTDTLDSLCNLANCISDSGRNAEAEPMYREVLEVRRRVLGADHLDVVDALNNLAICISSCGRYTEAEPLYREVLETRRRVLGADNPDTVESLNNLVFCINGCGRYTEAELLYREALLQQAQGRVVAAGHPDTLTALER